MKRNLLMLFVALSAVLTSCARKDTVTPNDVEEKKSVYVKISQAEGYAESAPVPAEYTVNISSGYIMFVDWEGTITNRVKIVSGTAGTGEISVSALASGANIPNIRSSAAFATVWCNMPDGFTIPSSGNYGNFRDTLILPLATQATFSKATLNGSGYIDLNGNSVIVPIVPTISRIEIGGLKALSPITGFELQAIYFDNFYTHRDFKGLNPAYLKTLTVNDIWSTPPAEIYSSTPAMYDFSATGLGTFSNNVVSLTNGNVWGYSIYSRTVMPRIIFHLTNIHENGSLASESKYLTISGLQTESGTAIRELEPGYVYSIAADALEFAASDLSVVPVLAPKTVNVSITNTAWTIQPTKPSYN